MKLSLCNAGLRKPLSTRHTTTGPRTQNTYIQTRPRLFTVHITCKSNTSSMTAENGGSAVVYRPSTFDLLIHNPSCTRVNNSTSTTPAPSTLDSPLGTVLCAQEQLTQLSPFAPPCFISPYQSMSLVSLVLTQVCHISLFSFALLAFLDEMV